VLLEKPALEFEPPSQLAATTSRSSARSGSIHRLFNQKLRELLYFDLTHFKP
jgi:hypothetical protein